MKHIKTLVFLALAVVLLAACAGAGADGADGATGPAGPQGSEGPAGPAGAAGADAEAAAAPTCTECHNDTSIITQKQTAWASSGHGSGTAYDYAGGRNGCSNCHAGDTFSDMVAAGGSPDEFEGADGQPTKQDCRACHQIHTSYTGDDWALETVAPVELYALEGVTFDGGKGNLCVSCHQPRRNFASQVTDGIVNVSSTHWGPHHGPQSAFLLGMGGSVDGSAGGHASMVEDTCVGCHVSEANHSFEPSLAVCQECHADAENFDINGVQTEVQALLDELEELLIAAGLLDEEGHPAVAEFPEAQGAALWNWIAIAHEDKSSGVHNPAYIISLLETSIEAMK